MAPRRATVLVKEIQAGSLGSSPRNPLTSGVLFTFARATESTEMNCEERWYRCGTVW